MQNVRHAPRPRLRALLCLTLFSLAPLHAQTAPSTNTLAVYGDAVAAEQLPPGWRFEWNAAGDMGQPDAYRPLTPVEVKRGRRVKRIYAAHNDAGEPLPNDISLSDSSLVRSIRDDSGAARFAIASYTLQADATGEVWINHGNVLNHGFAGALLHVYRNDQQVFSTNVVKNRQPFLFQRPLGRLRKGDTIRLAIAPEAPYEAIVVRLQFVIQEIPAGTRPGPPVNIIRPPIRAAEPRRDADGGYATYAARHEAQCNEVLERKSELVFLGDSITQRWPADLLEEHFAAYRPVNLGIGGDWVQNVLWRVRNGVLDQAPLRGAVLLIGTNNLSNRFTPEEIIQGINAILQALREEAPGARVLLLGILPRRGSIDAPLNDKVRAVNKGLAAIADGTHVVYLDVGPSLVEPDGTILRDVMPDQLHVARPGFLRWMKAMQPTLDRLLAGK